MNPPEIHPFPKARSEREERGRDIQSDNVPAIIIVTVIAKDNERIVRRKGGGKVGD